MTDENNQCSHHEGYAPDENICHGAWWNQNTVGPWFTNLICFTIWGMIDVFVFVWGRWQWSCLSPDVEFVNGRKVFLNTCLWIKFLWTESLPYIILLFWNVWWIIVTTDYESTEAFVGYDLWHRSTINRIPNVSSLQFRSVNLKQPFQAFIKILQ